MQEINGARLWVRVGPVNFQPGEAAKVLLVVFFAAYLVDKRELLAAGTRHIGRLSLPDPKHLGPLLLAWGFSILVMVREKDLGSSLLFFAVFAAMLYIATDRWSYLVVALGMFLAGAFVAYQLFEHVQDRVSSWIDPWSVSQTKGFQLVQSMFALGSGGFQGTGLGLGSPQKIPNASTDFVLSAIGEELGLLGTVAVCILFLLLVGSGFRIAIQADRPFSKLFAAGLTTIIGVQTFVIIGGRDPRDPAHRRDAAVHLVRRLVARRQLRDHRACCCASPTRRSRARRHPARSRPRGPRWAVGGR